MTSPSLGHLLIVDDEFSLMEALCKTLRDEGYEAEGVTSGEEALVRLRKPGIEVILTDLMMPKMDGIALLRNAQAIDAETVGIVMTGHGSIPTAVEAMKNGAIDYVLKPFKLGAMLPALERALTIRRLRVKNVELEKSVRERTAELETANEDLDAFCRSVSHDLRTPLRAISGFTDLLVKLHAPTLPPEGRRYVDLIHRGAGEMSQLITSLLAFSRVGRQAITRQPLNLSALSQQIFKDLEGEYRGRQVKFQVNPTPMVEADSDLTRQVLHNLIANAIKYSRSREVASLEFGTLPEPAGKTSIYFMRDNGVGFDMRHADKLFGVFQRLHYSHEFEGEGIGLATVRRIVGSHGGEVWAEAKPNEGATFFFSFAPLSKSERAKFGAP